MSLTLEELVETAIENQRIILELELKKGVPLNYLDVECQHVVHPPSLEAGGFLPRAECGRKKL